MSNQTIAPTTDTAIRYVAVGTDVHDTQSNRTAGFPTPSGAHVAAEWLNGPHGTPDRYGWTETTLTGAEIHPEIPMPHWATDRYLEDEGRQVIDERTTSHGNFDIELGRMYTFTETGRIDHDENIDVWWRSVWSDGGIDRERLTVRLDDIPDLIAALQHARQLMTNKPRALRRNLDATSELMERDQ